jgi:hypothetical protein
LADGGLFTQVQIDEPIVRCREAGYDDEDIIVDVIVCFDQLAEIEEWSLRDAKYKNAYDFYARQVEFGYYYLWYLEDILRIVKGFPNVNFRHLMMPTDDLGGGYVPIFDGLDQNIYLLEQGEKDARLNLADYLNYNTTNPYLEEDGEHHPNVQSKKLRGFDLIRQMIKDREGEEEAFL